MTARTQACLHLVNECGGAKLPKNLAAEKLRLKTTPKHAEAAKAPGAKPRSGWQKSLASQVRIASAAGIAATLVASVSATPGAPVESDRKKVLATLTIQNYIGTVEVIRSDTGRIEWIERAAGQKGDIVMEASADGMHLMVSGRSEPLGLNCTRQNGAVRVQHAGLDARGIDSFPDLVIAVPESTRVNVQVLAGSISLDSGEQIDGQFQGCSDVSIGASARQVKLNTTGGVSLQVKRADALDLNAQGGARVSIGEIAQTGKIDLAGASRVEIAEMTGALDAHLDGASRVMVASGETSDLALAMSGAARFEHLGEVDRADIELARAARADLASLEELNSVSLARAAKLHIANERVEG